MKTKSILFATLLIVAAPAVDAKGISQTVKFQKGAYSAEYEGKIRGYDYDSYFFTAKAGQRLTVNIDGENVYAVLNSKFMKDMVDVTDDTYTLSKSGTYEIRVLQPRNSARNGITQAYQLKVEIR